MKIENLKTKILSFSLTLIMLVVCINHLNHLSEINDYLQTEPLKCKVIDVSEIESIYGCPEYIMLLEYNNKIAKIKLPSKRQHDKFYNKIGSEFYYNLSNKDFKENPKLDKIRIFSLVLAVLLMILTTIVCCSTPKEDKISLNNLYFTSIIFVLYFIYVMI